MVSPIGRGIDSFWQGLLSAPIAPKNLGKFPEQMAPNQMYYGIDWDEEQAGHTGLGRAGAFALEAARQALAGSTARRVGLVIGTTMGSRDLLESEGAVADDHFLYRIAAQVAEILELTGPVWTVSTACSAGLYAASLGREALLSGDADAMLVGGCEAASRIPGICFNRMRAIDSLFCRPFSAKRAGTVGGEGAAVVRLETQQTVNSFAEFLADGWSCDAFHVTAPAPQGDEAERAMRAALREAGLAAGAIDCLIAHGTGTRMNDEIEAATIARVFGVAPEKGPWVVAPKAHLGHGGGASGAFSFLVGALIARHQVLPPALFLDAQDFPELRLNRGPAKPVAVQNVMVNSYGFGGNNISAVLSGSRP